MLSSAGYEAMRVERWRLRNFPAVASSVPVGPGDSERDSLCLNAYRRTSLLTTLSRFRIILGTNLQLSVHFWEPQRSWPQGPARRHYANRYAAEFTKNG
jgi:hypothetical protein